MPLVAKHVLHWRYTIITTIIITTTITTTIIIPNITIIRDPTGGCGGEVRAALALHTARPPCAHSRHPPLYMVSQNFVYMCIHAKLLLKMDQEKNWLCA